MAPARSVGGIEAGIAHIPRISKTGIMRADYIRAFSFANFSPIE
jgi:hypothetical protein